MEWIPVEERLPDLVKKAPTNVSYGLLSEGNEESEEVFVTLKDGRRSIDLLVKFARTNSPANWWRHGNDVTDWQPMPEHPGKANK